LKDDFKKIVKKQSDESFDNSFKKTIGERYWYLILIGIGAMAIIGITWIDEGFQKIEDSKKIENEEVSKLLQKLTVQPERFRDVFPEPEWLGEVEIYFDNYNEKLGLGQKTIFRVIANTNLNVKEFNFQIFHEDEDSFFKTEDIINEKKDTQAKCPQNPRLGHFRIFTELLQTGNEWPYEGMAPFSGNLGGNLTSPGTYYYYVGILTQDCDLHKFRSDKPVFTVLSYAEELQIQSNIAILKQITEQQRNNLVVEGFSIEF